MYGSSTPELRFRDAISIVLYILRRKSDTLPDTYFSHTILFHVRHVIIAKNTRTEMRRVRDPTFSNAILQFRNIEPANQSQRCSYIQTSRLCSKIVRGSIALIDQSQAEISLF